MKKFWLILFFLISLMIASCAEDPITRDFGQLPRVMNFYAPERAFLDEIEQTTIQVAIDDPQGVEDIASVVLWVSSSSAQIQMKDDGAAGDIIARDGQFVAKLSKSDVTNTGLIKVAATVQDNSGNQAKSDTLEIQVLAGSKGADPSILGVVVSDSARIDSTVNLTFLATAFDADGLENIDSVVAIFYKLPETSKKLSIQLFDDGQHGDSGDNDGVFGVQIKSTETGLESGNYLIRFVVYDKQQNRSEAATTNFRATKLGEEPPKIFYITMPDTVSRRRVDPIVITVDVTDRNGLSDIKRVYFNTFKPDGSGSSGNPWQMYDDGITSGFGRVDETANDGKYSLGIAINQSNAIGNYVFEFYAEDKANLVSEMVTYILTVTE